METELSDLSDKMKSYNRDLKIHIEEFAAAFIKKTGLDPSSAVMISRSYGDEQSISFRAKTEKEIELEKMSEVTVEKLRFCPVCPCPECQHKRSRQQNGD